VKSFEADVVEAQGYKGAIAAADELKGLLEGSKVVGTRKGLSPEQQAAYSSLPQVLGAVSDALGTAYNAVRPEVQSAALPVKVRGDSTRVGRVSQPHPPAGGLATEGHSNRAGLLRRLCWLAAVYHYRESKRPCASWILRFLVEAMVTKTSCAA
jgi:hypothetical protein